MTRQRAISISRLRLLAEILDEPTAVTHRGQTIGIFTPASVPTETFNAGVRTAYHPEAPAIELAKVAMEVALALSEIEALRDFVRPDKVPGRPIAREREFIRRRLHVANLRRDTAERKENHDHDDG